MVDIKKVPLHPGQYYAVEHKKTKICLHHTAGSSAAAAMGWWNETPERVATPYIIERDGTIFECYDPAYWAYSLGVKGSTELEKETIPIEIVSWGSLHFDKGVYKTYTGKIIPNEDVVIFDQPYRSSKFYHKYTAEQILALRDLLQYIALRFNIPLHIPNDKFYEFQDWKTLKPGIFSHTTVRKDKQDIFPQMNLINMLLAITEKG